MHNHKNLIAASLLVGIILASVGFFVFEFWEVLREGRWSETPTMENLTGHRKDTGANLKEDALAPFASEEDFREYLREGAQHSGSSLFSTIGGGDVMAFEESSGGMAVPNAAGVPTMARDSMQQSDSAGRFSTTNVQIAGIDEPDMFKSDGKNFFVSGAAGYSPYDDPFVMREMAIAPCAAGESCPPDYVRPRAETAVIKADPAEELAKQAMIPKTGELLLFGKTLVVLSGRELTGYDVADPSEPKELWVSTVPEGKRIVEARAADDRLFLIESEAVNMYRERLCPIQPLVMKGETVAIPCGEVYHPVAPLPIDTTYAVLRIDPATGRVEKQGAFVGASDRTVIMMNGEHLFLAYRRDGDIAAIFAGFISESGLFPAAVVDHINEVRGYSLSDTVKLSEIMLTVERYQSGLSRDERLTFETRLENAGTEYMKQHRRELEYTSIVRVGTGNLSVEATGRVAGRLLNQFALDEYDGHLRVATTIGEGMFSSGNRATENEVAVLDDDLRGIGSVGGLGKGERIYSVRFIGERGFLVTFRQTDPFYVLDLSDPQKPIAAGELKIPGYSSYLHPLTESLVLGVGREGSAVKLSLFDVRDATNPTEVSKYTFAQEYWSEALDNHRAFLADPKREVIFIPGSRGGYVVSYAGRKLDLAKAIEGGSVKRAAYIGETFYVVSDRRVVALDEDDWSEIKRLEW